MAIDTVTQLRMGGQGQYSKKHILKKIQIDNWTDGPTEDIGFMNTQYCFVRKNFDFLKVKEIESVSISFAYCSGLAILS